MDCLKKILNLHDSDKFVLENNKTFDFTEDFAPKEWELSAGDGTSQFNCDKVLFLSNKAKKVCISTGNSKQTASIVIKSKGNVNFNYDFDIIKYPKSTALYSFEILLKKNKDSDDESILFSSVVSKKGKLALSLEENEYLTFLISQTNPGKKSDVYLKIGSFVFDYGKCRKSSIEFGKLKRILGNHGLHHDECGPQDHHGECGPQGHHGECGPQGPRGPHGQSALNFIKRTIYTNPGSQNLMLDSKTKNIYVQIVGGGGAGGDADINTVTLVDSSVAYSIGAGGGSGCYVEKWMSKTNDTINTIVGAGGNNDDGEDSQVAMGSDTIIAYGGSKGDAVTKQLFEINDIVKDKIEHLLLSKNLGLSLFLRTQALKYFQQQNLKWLH
jgi:hypothetical protein